VDPSHPVVPEYPVGLVGLFLLLDLVDHAHLVDLVDLVDPYLLVHLAGLVVLFLPEDLLVLFLLFRLEDLEHQLILCLRILLVGLVDPCHLVHLVDLLDLVRLVDQMDQLDPYQDGQACLRMGSFIRWAVEALENGDSQIDALSIAKHKFYRKWKNNLWQ